MGLVASLAQLQCTKYFRDDLKLRGCALLLVFHISEDGPEININSLVVPGGFCILFENIQSTAFCASGPMM